MPSPTRQAAAASRWGGGSGAAGKISVGTQGGDQAVSVMQPYLGVNYIIALQGVFPSRS